MMMALRSALACHSSACRFLSPSNIASFNWYTYQILSMSAISLHVYFENLDLINQQCAIIAVLKRPEVALATRNAKVGSLFSLEFAPWVHVPFGRQVLTR